MRALVYTGTESLEMRDVPVPDPGPGQSVVDVALCGICGSDMHAYHGHDARRVPPLVLGHEAVGVVSAGPHQGERVAINPLMTCGTCRACRGGAEHLCAERALIGLKVPGAFAEQVAISGGNLTVLPEGLGFDRAVLAEPLAVTVHTAELGLARAGEPSGLSAVVLGGGAIGLLTALVLKVRGVGDVRVAETNGLRREMLAGIGLSAYDPRAGGPEPGSADMVIDAVGSGSTRKASSVLVRAGGTIVHVGLQDNAEGLDTRRITLEEIAFIGSYCYTAADFAEAVALLADGKISGEGWTETRPLDTGAQGFRDIDNGTAPPKIVLAM